MQAWHNGAMGAWRGMGKSGGMMAWAADGRHGHGPEDYDWDAYLRKDRTL